MPQVYTTEQKKQFQAYLKLYLKEDQRGLSEEEQIEIIQKKNRSKWWHLAINILAIAFFTYSFFEGITQLSDILLYILFGVFVINVGMIFYQKKQMNRLVAYLKWKNSNH